MKTNDQVAVMNRLRMQSGFTLIELMIAMVLGLLVVAAAGAIFLSSQRVYGMTETSGRIQENQRASYELMARDIREAGGSPCNTLNPPVIMLKDSTASFWDLYRNGLGGTEGGANPDSIDLYSGNDAGIQIVEHDNPSAVLAVSSVDGVKDGDVLMACNVDVSIVFGVTAIPGSGKFLQHNSTSNYCQEFQYKKPEICKGASGAFGYCFKKAAGKNFGPGCTGQGKGPAIVVRPSAIRWEVKANGRGSNSLYRSVYGTTKDGLSATASSTAEVAEGVSDLQFKYQSRADPTKFENADVVADWGNVMAVQMVVKMVGVRGAQSTTDLKGTGGAALERTLTNTIALRNKQGVL
ncbi:prepilin-type N-terminal cleavage/methylation domain-containing protein [Thermomonas sp.]